MFDYKVWAAAPLIFRWDPKRSRHSGYLGESPFLQLAGGRGAAEGAAVVLGWSLHCSASDAQPANIQLCAWLRKYWLRALASFEGVGSSILTQMNKGFLIFIMLNVANIARFWLHIMNILVHLPTLMGDYSWCWVQLCSSGLGTAISRSHERNIDF